MDFIRLMDNPLIAGQILHHVDALSLSSLQCTSKLTRSLVEAHYGHVFRALLAQYFDNVDNFLIILQRLGGCITGSQALKLIMNDASATWEAKDLDISIPCGSKTTLTSYLERFEGYTIPSQDVWTSQRLGYHQILKRQRLKSVTKLKGKNGQLIDILESCSCSCIAPLCEFHSTAVVNALFPDRMTCFFPSHTLRYRSIPNALYQNERDRRSVAKYSGRGELKTYVVACQLHMDWPASYPPKLTFTRLAAVTGVECDSRGRSPTCKHLDYRCIICHREQKERSNPTACQIEAATSCEAKLPRD